MRLPCKPDSERIDAPPIGPARARRSWTRLPLARSLQMRHPLPSAIASGIEAARVVYAAGNTPASPLSPNSRHRSRCWGTCSAPRRRPRA